VAKPERASNQNSGAEVQSRGHILEDECGAGTLPPHPSTADHMP
jgi:hypothetical protein